jgi:urease alpha subunit
LPELTAPELSSFESSKSNRKRDSRRPKRLPAATIVPATLVGMERHTGSIKVGKTADLALVQGDPSTHITDCARPAL